ncbi:MAG: hypothetical protein K2N22_05240 [Clostridia bacterium]|nr:hypothetical protein [Clostridia bacterium]
MSGYTKNIAVIRELKNGFSADGGPLTGLVKAERYGAKLRAEVSLINFAPLTEGRYVAAISDGTHTQILDNGVFEGYSDVDTGAGFAALVCFVNGAVSPIASAVCGNFQSAALGIKDFIERAEKPETVQIPTETAYEDEAIAQENYYEYEQANTDGGSVRKDKTQEKNGRKSEQNEEGSAHVKSNRRASGLARGECFYKTMKGEIDKLLSTYPAENNLEKVVENSRWVKISYGGDKFYVFGIIYQKDTPQYICYGVPTDDSKKPPESLKGLATFIPASAEGATEGFWVMYQDAATGASVKIQSA